MLPDKIIGIYCLTNDILKAGVILGMMWKRCKKCILDLPAESSV